MADGVLGVAVGVVGLVLLMFGIGLGLSVLPALLFQL